MTTRHAVTVVGGGAVGACTAALLQARGRIARGEVLLVDRGFPQAPAAAAPLDLRVSAISRSSRRLLESLGAWEKLDPARLAAYERLRVWVPGQDPRGAQALCFDAAEIAEPDLGCIVENRALQAALLESARHAGVGLLEGTVTGVERGAQGMRLSLADATALDTGLLVVADGAQSPLRESLGIPIHGRAYEQRAIVAKLAPVRAHEATAWQCFLPTGPVALLPLPAGEVSLVWSAREDRAQALLEMDDAAFCAELEGVMGPALGAFRLIGERASFPLRRLTAERWCEPGCVLVGDAAHTLHPLAGQGLNQGLLDAAALCAEVAARPARESPGALRALRRYERARRVQFDGVAAVVDGFDRSFTGVGPAPLLGRAALATAARSRALRALFMREAGGSTAGARR